MTNLEVYYKGVLSMLESYLIEIDEVIFDIDFQLKDENMSSRMGDEWKSRARFKLRKTRAHREKIRKAIKGANKKIHISNRLINQVKGVVNIKASACVAYIEHEVMVNVLKSKLKSEMGMENYIKYARSELDAIELEVREKAESHLIKANKMPAAINIYNWKRKL